MNVFKDLKILELCRVYSGPLCGMTFGDLGAKVIKVERPGFGDESRHFGQQDKEGRSPYFNSLNRNKRSLPLDLKEASDREQLIEFIKESDVLIHNWLQKSLDKLGFSYEEVKRINPRIIYCVISGYGYESPYKNNPSQDIIAQSLSGFMSLTGEPNRNPLKTGIPVVDHVTGMTAAFSIMSALYMREKNGEGQLVHTSLLENALAMTSFESSRYLASGIIPKQKGNRHPTICPYNVYQVDDGLVTIAVANDQMWIRFCKALGLEAYSHHPHYERNALRLEHQDQLELILEDVLKVQKVDQLVDKLTEFGVSCAKVNNMEEALNHPAITCLDMVKVFPDGSRTIGKAFHLEGLKESVYDTPPKLI